jgi:hypothetical protein
MQLVNDPYGTIIDLPPRREVFRRLPADAWIKQ